MTEITVKLEKKELKNVLNLINQDIDKYENIPLKLKLQLELVIEEIFVNILSHSQLVYNCTIKIDFKLEKNPIKAIVTFTDKGIEYNPLKIEDPDTDSHIDNRDIGGLGIFLIKKNVDAISYKYENNQNILRFEKILE